jgi:hypothetical protein
MHALVDSQHGYNCNGFVGTGVRSGEARVGHAVRKGDVVQSVWRDATRAAEVSGEGGRYGEEGVEVFGAVSI